MSTDPTARFSDKVAAYVRARPDYPSALLELLGSPGVAADVGAGTGLLSRLLLAGGWEVRAVEPNRSMAAAAIAELGEHPRFQLLPGRAEALPLEDSSVDLIVAGQAFHWFEVESTRIEWCRVLRSTGQVALVWNDRATEQSAFLQGYEALLGAFGTDYRQVHHRNLGTETFGSFFGGDWRTEILPHEQILGREGLRDRLLSCSYVPAPEDPRHAEMLGALDDLFDVYSSNGRVVFPYRTRVCLGQMASVRPRDRARIAKPG